MSGDHDHIQKERTVLGRLRHSLMLLIVLDLVTLGFYSATRCYLLHKELSRKISRRLFSLAFLHILIVLNLALWVLRFSRDSQPLDATLIMVQLGTALLFVSLLLIFRRYLQEDFHLRIRPLSLSIFGFWYLQYQINRAQPHANSPRLRESRLIPLRVIAIYVALSLATGTIKHYRVSDVSMEPTLVVGDHVLVDRLSYTLYDQPEPGDLLVSRSTSDENTVTIKRLLGLPGDHISFHKDIILVNGRPLACTHSVLQNRTAEASDRSPKLSMRCQLKDRSFTMHRNQQGSSIPAHGNFTVPEGHYFMVGDNLDHLPDSRTIGAIPAGNILGHVRMITISYRLGESIPWYRWFQVL